VAVETDPVGSPAPAIRVIALAPPTGGLPDGALPGAASRAAVAAAIERLRVAPDDVAALLDLGFAAYQLGRETADPAEHGRAEAAFAAVLELDPDNVDAHIGAGTIALARHAFRDALRSGERARDLAPGSARPLGVIADALVELGRYPEAVETVQAMVDLRPDLASYARVSYLRELHGRLPGAIEAMEAAIEAGGPVIEHTEYLRVALGDLWFKAGDLDRASGTYATALERSPGYVPALAGEARVAAARGDLAGAIARWEAATEQVPLPELLIGLGEAQEAAGRTADAHQTYQLVRDIGSLFAANGVRTDLELARFEADHGDPGVAVRLARAAFAEAPDVKAADALAWALYRVGELDEAREMAERAIALGSLEPAFWYHAGMIAAAQGDRRAARAWLARSLAANPAWSPLHAPRAAAALATLGDGPVATPTPEEAPR
jgi:tetratricopeptide (TPR) repeat protein